MSSKRDAEKGTTPNKNMGKKKANLSSVDDDSTGASNEEQQEHQEEETKFMNILRQLGIDYDSKVSDFANNDELKEYVSDAVEKLMKICDEAPNNGRNFCWASIKAAALKNGRVLVLGHFPPDSKKYHINGVLSAVKSRFNPSTNTREDEATNSIPANPTTYVFFQKAAMIMMSRYGITMDQAVMLCMQIFAWIDMLPIDGHYSMGDEYVGSGTDRRKNSYHQGYIDLRKLTDEHAAKYIKEILAQLPNIEAVIILGSPAWKFVQENPDLIPEEFIIQHGPIVHPCVSETFRFTDRQAYDFCDVISRVLARILGDDSTSIITNMDQVNNIHKLSIMIIISIAYIIDLIHISNNTS